MKFKKIFLICTLVIGHATLLMSSCKKDNTVPAPKLPVVVNADSICYVATNGKDSNAGTIEAPFHTLEQARDYMRTSISSVKKIYIRAGKYNRSTTLQLTAADNGETWSYYPSDGYNTVILDGGGLGGTTTLILIQGGNNITISGLQLQNFQGSGIAIHGGTQYMDVPYGPLLWVTTGTAYGNTIINNIIKDGNTNLTGTPAYSGLSFWGDVQNTSIKNNVVSNMTGTGIAGGVLQVGPSNGINNLDIENNVVLNANTSINDCGGIYIIDRMKSSTNIRIKNNFVRDYGVWSKSANGIYCDDQVSNVTISGNIVAGTGSMPIMYHGGENITVTGNIFDLGSTGDLPVVLYGNSVGGETMTGNKFIGNIILSSYITDGARFKPNWGGPYYGAYLDITAPNAYVTPLQVQDNFYHNYSTGGEKIGGGYSGPNYRVFDDSNPVLGDPQISGWNYDIASGSPVYNSPVSFPAILGGWGPPGYVIPHTGTQPSCPH